MQGDPPATADHFLPIRPSAVRSLLIPPAEIGNNGAASDSRTHWVHPEDFRGASLIWPACMGFRGDSRDFSLLESKYCLGFLISGALVEQSNTTLGT